MHRPHRIGGGGDLLKNNPGLTPHPQRFQRYDVDDVAKLGKDGVEGLFQFWGDRTIKYLISKLQAN